MNTKNIKELADAIATELMTNGNNQEATRLQLMLKVKGIMGETDLGGRNKDSVIGVIETALSKAASEQVSGYTSELDRQHTAMHKLLSVELAYLNKRIDDNTGVADIYRHRASVCKGHIAILDGIRERTKENIK